MTGPRSGRSDLKPVQLGMLSLAMAVAGVSGCGRGPHTMGAPSAALLAGGSVHRAPSKNGGERRRVGARIEAHMAPFAHQRVAGEVCWVCAVGFVVACEGGDVLGGEPDLRLRHLGSESSGVWLEQYYPGRHYGSWELLLTFDFLLAGDVSYGYEAGDGRAGWDTPFTFQLSFGPGFTVYDWGLSADSQVVTPGSEWIALWDFHVSAGVGYSLEDWVFFVRMGVDIAGQAEQTTTELMLTIGVGGVLGRATTVGGGGGSVGK